MKRTTIILVLLALVLGACGADADSGTTLPPSTTTPPDDDGPARVLLTISNEGGFAPVEFVLNRPPTFTVLTDGTLIFEGPQIEIFPGPVMPAMQQIKLTSQQMQDIQVLIEAIGLPTIDDLINNDAANFVADATSTVAVYTDDEGGKHRIEVYGLGMPETSDDQLANLSLLVDKLSGYAFSADGGEAYRTDTLIVRLIEGGGFGGEINDVRDWEFAFEPAIDPANQFPCLVAVGSDAEAIRALLADATQATQWEHANGTFMVLARDLLPGETGCDSL